MNTGEVKGSEGREHKELRSEGCVDVNGAEREWQLKVRERVNVQVPYGSRSG